MHTENLGSASCGACGELAGKKLGHEDGVLFQPQNFVAYVDKNQLQKCYQEISSEEEPRLKHILNFCLIHFCNRQQRKRVKQLLSDTSKPPFLFLFFWGWLHMTGKGWWKNE